MPQRLQIWASFLWTRAACQKKREGTTTFQPKKICNFVTLTFFKKFEEIFLLKFSPPPPSPAADLLRQTTSYICHNWGPVVITIQVAH